MKEEVIVGLKVPIKELKSFKFLESTNGSFTESDFLNLLKTFLTDSDSLSALGTFIFNEAKRKSGNQLIDQMFETDFVYGEIVNLISQILSTKPIDASIEILTEGKIPRTLRIVLDVEEPAMTLSDDIKKVKLEFNEGHKSNFIRTNLSKNEPPQILRLTTYTYQDGKKNSIFKI